MLTDEQEKWAAIQKLHDVPAEEMAEQMQYARKAARHLIGVAKMRCGMDVELYGAGLEKTGRFDFDELKHEAEMTEDLEEWRNVLFSCHVLERQFLGGYVEAFGYPKLVKAMEAALLRGLLHG